MGQPMNIIITGGRHHAERALVWDWLDQLYECMVIDGVGDYNTSPLTIVQGGATGVDKHAREWCMTRGVNFKNYPYPKQLGKAGGPIRNREMAMKEKPEFVVSFTGGRGTRSMCRIARELGIPVIVAEESPAGIPSQQFQPRYKTVEKAK